MPRRPTHCQLFVMLARRGPKAVVFRRGPATWTQLITWSTKNDVFEAGQWFHGKVYERRCDLSPSGDKLIYFVAKHHLQKVDPSYTSAWTAISRPPYFTALALWPNAGTTYHGGGLFGAEDTVMINSVDNRWSNPERGGLPRIHPKHLPPKQVRVSPIAFTSGDQLFPKRLVRDGWTLTGGSDLEKDTMDPSGHLVRELKNWRLELAFGYHKMEYALFEKTKGRWDERAFEAVSWADFDDAGRLVFAKEGKLFAVRGTQAGPELEVDLLADFDDRKPSRVIAPPLARKW